MNPSLLKPWLSRTRNSIVFRLLWTAAISGAFIVPAEGQESGPSIWDPGFKGRLERTLPPIPDAREALANEAIQTRASTAVAPIVAILDFDSRTLSTGHEQALARAVWNEFYLSPSTRVIPRREMRWYLIEWDLYPHQPVGPPVSIHQSARALKADYFLDGNVNVADGAFMVDYRVYSTRLRGILLKNSLVRQGDLRDLAMLMPEVAKSIIASIEYAELNIMPSAMAVNAISGNPGSRLEAAEAPTEGVGSDVDPAGATAGLILIEEPDDSGTDLDTNPPLDRAEAAAAERERTRLLDRAYHEEAPSDASSSESGKEPEPMTRDEIEQEVGGGIIDSTEPFPELLPEPTRQASEIETMKQEVELSEGPVFETAASEETTEAAREIALLTSHSDSPPQTNEPEQPRVHLEPLEQPVEASTSDDFLNTTMEDTGELMAAGATESVPDLESPERREAALAFEASRSLEPEDYEGRIALLEKAVSLDPGTPEYSKSLALNYYKAGRYGPCIGASRRAASLAPDDSIILTILGSAYFETGQYAAARRAHESSLELDPSNLYSRFNLALTLEAEGKPEALNAWQEYLEMSEGVPAQVANRQRALEYYEHLKAARR